MTDREPAKATKAKATKPAKAEPTEYVVVQIIGIDSPLADALAVHLLDPADNIAVAIDTLTATGNEKTLIEKWAAEKKRTGAFKLVPARSWKGGVRVFEQTTMASEAIA